MTERCLQIPPLPLPRLPLLAKIFLLPGTTTRVPSRKSMESVMKAGWLDIVKLLVVPVLENASVRRRYAVSKRGMPMPSPI
jgi:hypothetical protein